MLSQYQVRSDTKNCHQNAMNALFKAIESQPEEMNVCIKKFLNESKYANMQSAKDVLPHLIKLMFIRTCDMSLLKEHDESLNSNTHKQMDQLRNELKNILKNEDTEFLRNISSDFLKFLRNNLQNNNINFLTFRENFILQLMYKTVKSTDNNLALRSFVLSESLNWQSFFKSTKRIPEELLTVNFKKILEALDTKTEMEHLPSDSSARKQVYHDLAGAYQRFRDCNADDSYCKADDRYKRNKNEEIHIACSEMHKIDDLEALNQLYTLSKTYVNKHKHFLFDLVTGLQNTKSWQVVAKEMRTKALATIKVEVDRIQGSKEKISYLLDAKKLEIIKEHRNNYALTGAFFRTAAQVEIDQLISNVRESYTMRNH